MLNKEETLSTLQAFNKYVIKQARTNLTKGKKNVSKSLYNSIKSTEKVNPNSIESFIEMEQYGQYLDKGVKGKFSGQRSPDSPFKFGSGTGKPGGLTEGIRGWVKARRFQFKDRETGRFMSYEQTAQLITRSIWCYIDAKINLGGAEQYQANQTLLAVDGFGYHTELANPEISTLPDTIYRREKVLTSIDNHIIYNNSDYPLYFVTTGLVSLTINGTNVPFTFDQDIANQNIAYVNIANYIGSSTSFSAVFFYDATEVPSVTINFTIKDECKYPLINCIFKNKYGFWQTIPFNKLSKKTQDFTNESYNGLISNYGAYNLNTHVKRTYNINGREKVTVNTDFIPEEYNALFTELMLSEFVYLEENGTVLPVNVVKTSFEKKTKLINKLIQYSMDFEYSFDLLNNIQ